MKFVFWSGWGYFRQMAYYLSTSVYFSTYDWLDSCLLIHSFIHLSIQKYVLIGCWVKPQRMGKKTPCSPELWRGGGKGRDAKAAADIRAALRIFKKYAHRLFRRVGRKRGPASSENPLLLLVQEMWVWVPASKATFCNPVSCVALFSVQHKAFY